MVRYVQFVLLLIVGISTTILLIACENTPKPPTVGDISVDPGTDIIVGESASLTVIASGQDLQFKWKAARGQLLSNSEPSAIYTAPKTPGPDTVDVTVTGRGGTGAVQSITFQVVMPTPTSTDTPTPTNTPTIASTSTATATSTFAPTATATSTPPPSPTPTDIPPPPPTGTPTSTPLPASIVVANFDNCLGTNNLKGNMGAAFDPPDFLKESYIPEEGRGCVARLEYQIPKVYAAFWMKLQGMNTKDYNTVTFYAKGDSTAGIPQLFKVEVKRNNNAEMSIIYLSNLSDKWQQFAIPYNEFVQFFDFPALSGWDNLSELAFTFEIEKSGQTGVIFVDDIAFEKR